MERHKCKLCMKSFANGRALGGHMRSHMLTLPIPSKPEEDEGEEYEEAASQLSKETESASSSSSSSDEEAADDENVGQCYGLRENPRRSIRVADPEFSFTVDPGSVVLQDRESETESNRNKPRRRSKRNRKFGGPENLYKHQDHQQDRAKKLKLNQLGCEIESWVEPEPLSSVSDTTTEEDLAFCLMMLSRGKWKKKTEFEDEDDDQEEDNDGETDESDEFKSSKNGTRGKYKCETCNKMFKSYQALGGHRASHKKQGVCRPEHKHETEQQNASVEKKIYECPICFRVFSSGQALGGHKRSHGIALTEAPLPVKRLMKQRPIDLNLPAPVDDDDINQIQKPVLFDAC